MKCNAALSECSVEVSLTRRASCFDELPRRKPVLPPGISLNSYADFLISTWQVKHRAVRYEYRRRQCKKKKRHHVSKTNKMEIQCDMAAPRYLIRMISVVD